MGGVADRDSPDLFFGNEPLRTILDPALAPRLAVAPTGPVSIPNWTTDGWETPSPIGRLNGAPWPGPCKCRANALLAAC